MQEPYRTCWKESPMSALNLTVVSVERFLRVEEYRQAHEAATPRPDGKGFGRAVRPPSPGRSGARRRSG